MLFIINIFGSCLSVTVNSGMRGARLNILNHKIIFKNSRKWLLLRCGSTIRLFFHTSCSSFEPFSVCDAVLFYVEV